MLERQELLVGVFAVQFGFASVEDMRVAAAEAKPGVPFALWLEEHGFLSGEQRLQVEQTVRDALRANSNDPQQALETLGGRKTIDRCFGASVSSESFPDQHDATLVPNTIDSQFGGDAIDDRRGPTLDDRDLLAGLLAVRRGYTSADRLRDAISEDGPKAPLLVRLEAGQILDALQRQEVERSVHDTLVAHGGDPGRALQGLGGLNAIEECFGSLPAGHTLPITVDDTILPGTFDESAKGSDLPSVAAGMDDDNADATIAAHDDPATAGAYAEPHDVTSEAAGRYVYLTPSGTIQAPTKEAAEIGRGGIGRVLVARDSHLGRNIAVKELLSFGGPGSTAATTGGIVDRFLREARVTGQLEHPAIIPVYEVGRRADGTLYYTMKLVRGRTLAEALEACDDLADRLKLLGHFISLCQAMAYAHSRGVIHRDIKPANVMVGEFGETIVLDWGLAKVRGKEDIQSGKLEREIEDMRVGGGSQTLAGDTMGTPAYMSPEQAKGRLEHIDEQSDVWSLGGVLYEILTGRPPFAGRNPYEVLDRVMKEEVPLASEVFAAAPPELSAVAAKALTRDRAARYATARDLAEDIDAYLHGQQVSTYNYGSWELVQRYAARHRAALTVAAIGMALLVVGSVRSYQNIEAEKDRALIAEQAALSGKSRAEAAERTADERATYAREMLARAFIEKARSASSHDRHAAQAYAAASLAQAPGPEARGIVVDMDSARRRRLMWRSPGAVECLGLAQSATPPRIACASRTGVVVWDAVSGRETARMKSRSWVAGVAFSPDGRRVASGGHDRTVRIWDAATGREISVLRGHANKVWAVAFSPDGKLLASASHDGTLRLWDLELGKPRRVLKGHGKKVWSVAFSPDGALLVSGGSDTLGRVWRVDTGEQLSTLRGHGKAVLTVAFSPDGETVATSSADWTARLWRSRDGQALGLLEGHEKSVIPLAFTPDGRTLVTGSADHSIRLWDVATRNERAKLVGHRGWVWALSMSPDGQSLVSAGRDITVRTWNLASHRQIRHLAGHGDDVTTVAFSPDGRLAASGSRDKTLRIWQVSDGTERMQMSSHHEAVTCAAFAPDGRTIAVGSEDRLLRLWDVASGREVARFEGHGNRISALAWSPDGGRVATGDGRGEVRVWTRQRPDAAPQTFSLDGDPVTSLTWAPDGTRLAAGGGQAGGTLRVWTVVGRGKTRTRALEAPVRAIAFDTAGARLAVASGEEVMVLASNLKGDPVQIGDHAATVRALAWGPKGQLGSAGDDGSLRTWDLASRREISRMATGRGPVTAIAWSPITDRILAGGAGNHVTLWKASEAADGAQTRDLAYGSPIKNLAWAADGARVVAAGAGPKIHVWDAVSGQALRRLGGERGASVGLALSGDGGTLLSGDKAGRVALFKLDSGEVLFERHASNGKLYGVGISGDGRTMAWSDGELRVARRRGGEVREVDGPWTEGDDPVRAIALSPDGRTLAAADWGTNVTLWDLDRGAKLRQIAAPPPFLSYLGFSPSGGGLITAGSDGDVVVWHPGSGEAIARVAGGGVEAVAATVSPDDQVLAIATADGAIQVREMPSGRGLARWAGPGDGTIAALAFGRSSSVLASAGAEGVVRFWRLSAAKRAPDALLDQALEQGARALSGVELGADPTWSVTALEALPDGR